MTGESVEPLFNSRKRLTPIVVLVTDDTLHALNDYVTTTEAIIRLDAPDVEAALDGVGRNGWTPTMLIAGQLLTAALGDHDE
jgi:hypothetical protein